MSSEHRPSSRSFRLLKQVVGWVLFLGLMLLCVQSKGSTRVFTWPWAFYAQLLLIAPIVLAGWQGLKHPGSSATGGCGVLLCAGSVAVSVLLSRNPHFSFEAALYLWGALAWMWWLSQRLHAYLSSESAFQITARIGGLALAAPMVSSVILWGNMISSRLIAARSPAALMAALGSARNPHPFGHWNYTGAFALIALPWLVCLALVERGRWRILWILASLLCPLLIFSSASRGAVLGTLVLLVAALALAWLAGQLSRRSALWLLLGGALLAVFVALTNVRIRQILTDPSALQYPSVGDVQRLAMLQGGRLLGQERPWVGHGPGMVPFVFPEVRAQLIGGVETSYQLHNAYLHQWVTTGLLGIGSGLILAVSLFQATRRWLRQPPGNTRIFALGSAASLVGYATMAATDYQLDVIGILAALGLPAALVLAAPRDDTPRVPSARNLVDRIPGGLTLAGGLAAIVVLLPHWRARELHWNAWASHESEERIAVLTKFLNASNAAPWNTHYRNQLGLQLARDAQSSGQPAQRVLARNALFASLALDSAQEPIHANLGWLWLPDEPGNAAIEFQRALALIPDRDTVHFGLAEARLAIGDEAGAIHALALECLVNPPFIASPLWARADFAPLHAQVEGRLDQLLSSAARHSAMPQWRQRDLRYFNAFLRWWRGGATPSGDELNGAEPLQIAFFAQAASDSGNAPAQAYPAPWTELVSSSVPRDIPAAAREGTATRRQMGVNHVPDLVRMKPPSPAGVIGLSIERAHYPLMHRNLDGPGYLDLAPRVEDAFAQRYAEPLFPARGLIPGRVLQDLEVGKDIR